MIGWLFNWKGWGGKPLWPNLWYSSKRTDLKVHKSVRIAQCPGQDSNWAPSECKLSVTDWDMWFCICVLSCSIIFLFSSYIVSEIYTLSYNNEVRTHWIIETEMFFSLKYLSHLNKWKGKKSNIQRENIREINWFCFKVQS